MYLTICIFNALIFHVDGLSTRVKGTSSDSVLISYNGQPADIEDNLGLKYRRKVLTN